MAKQYSSVCVCTLTSLVIHFLIEYKLLSFKMNKILGSNVQHVTIVNNSVYLEIAKKIDFKSCHCKTNSNYAAWWRCQPRQWWWSFCNDKYQIYTLYTLRLYNVIYQLFLHKAEGKRIVTQLNQSDKGRSSALMKASSCLLKTHHRYIFGEFFLSNFLWN